MARQYKIFTYFNKDPHSELDNYFVQRNKFFWKKKVPVGKQYHYTVLDPFEVLGFNTGYEKLYLVGDNWLDNPHKPIAIVIGCNDWKFGFIADYLPEYRVAFGSRKMVGLNMAHIIARLNPKPSIAVIWGYTESKWLNLFLKYKKIPIWRCEDGFIRSADLGANGATPYSLVFDRTGLYYNPQIPSELTHLLNNHDFTNQEREKAIDLYDLILKTRVSKYNHPISTQDKILKISKRVLVIGQVDGDASLRFGNIDGWNSETMIKLAKYENPACEIVYRPHPEVYKGFQKSRLNLDKISAFCTIQDPNVDIIDALEKADHIYTITSLVGLEALLRNKKVTLLGKAFYGGWGLTDDRVGYDELERKRRLSLLELFIGCYLLYPKYLVSLNDNYLGLFSTIYRVKAEKFIGINPIANKIKLEQNDEVDYIMQTYSWVNLLEKASAESNDKEFIRILSQVQLGKIFASTELSQQIFIYYLIGKAKTQAMKNHVLIIIRNYVSSKLYNKVLLELHNFSHTDKLYKHWVWLLSDTNNPSYAIDMIQQEIDKIAVSNASQYHTLTIEDRNNFEKVSFDAPEQPTQTAVLTEADLILIETERVGAVSEIIVEKFDVQFEYRDLSGALDSLLRLFLLGYNARVIFQKLSNVLRLMAKYKELQFISQLFQGLDIYANNRLPIVQEMYSRVQLGFRNDNELLEFLSRMLVLKPEMIEMSKILLEAYLSNPDSRDYHSKLEFNEQFLKSQLFFEKEFQPRRIQAYIAVEEFYKAEKLARMLVDGNINSQVQYAQALSYNNKVMEAVEFMESAVRSNFVKTGIQELLRLNVLASRYGRSLEILREAEAKGIKLGDMHLRKAYFGNRMIGEALKAFKDINVVQLVKKYYRNKYINIEDFQIDFNSIILLSVFGPGDEIRFASIYNFIQQFFTNQEIYITCSPRLKTLFERSFNQINFVGVHRPRGTEIVDLSNYTNVPGSDIYTLIDNNAQAVIDKVDKIASIPEFLHIFLPNYESFPGKPYLKCDPFIQQVMKNRIENISQGNLLVGLSWRSSLTTTSRNEHYLSVEELESLFNIPNIQYVNLQYDECSAEVAWVNERYPGKLINFEDIDQYNDFESVAALMSCLDLVIAPATTVAELAGALGIRTWLFSNSSEIDWRKINNEGTDVWHNSIIIVDVLEKGNKEKLVAELYTRLSRLTSING